MFTEPPISELGNPTEQFPHTIRTYPRPAATIDENIRSDDVATSTPHMVLKVLPPDFPCQITDVYATASVVLRGSYKERFTLGTKLRINSHMRTKKKRSDFFVVYVGTPSKPFDREIPWLNILHDFQL